MSKRYFINNLDGLIGNSIIKELTKGDEEIEPAHMGTYLEQTRLDKGRGVKKILKRIKPKLSRKKMLEECDVYIYDLLSMINSNNKQDYSDIRYVNEILANTPLEEQKVMILISDVRVWSKTPKKIKEVVPEPKGEGEEGEGEEGEGEGAEKSEKDEQGEEEEVEKEPEEQEEKEEGEEGQEGEEGEKKEKQEEEQQQEEEEVEVPVEYAPYTENDFESRVPMDKYKKMKKMEDLILQLQGRENLKILIVCSGVLYGEGEVVFRNHFKAAWLQNPKMLPFLGEGNNLIPTIHVQDLAKFVIKVAENPPENSYCFAIDNSKDRTQKAVVQAISNGIGSKLVESVEKTILIDQHAEDIFNLDLDWTPNPLMVSNDPENPAEFEWHCELGLIENTQKVLKEFWEVHNLRPMKILMATPEDERKEEQSQFDWITKKISQHYRIPILNIKDMIQEAAAIQDDILGADTNEEMEKLLQYLEGNCPRNIDETLKVLYRIIKWRLSQNDCMNRGYILDNYPLFTEEAEWIFYPQKPKKLERVRPKPKKMKRRRKKKVVEDEQNEGDNTNREKEEQNENNESRQEDKEDQEDEEEEGPKTTSIENQHEDQEKKEEGEGEDEEKQDDEDAEGEGDDDEYEYYEEEEVEEEKPEGEEENAEEEVEEEQDEEGQTAPKVEFFYPESFIFVKRMERVKKDSSPQSLIMDFFSQNQNEVQVFDTFNKDQFEIFESLRIYIERNKRPYNYLQPENELNNDHVNFYNKRNDQIMEMRKQKQIDQGQQLDAKKAEREKICQEQIEYVFNNEGEIDIIKNLPFRNYLLEYVVPELNDGLVEVSNFFPDDPVEFLAEYLYEKSFEFAQN